MWSVLPPQPCSVLFCSSVESVSGEQQTESGWHIWSAATLCVIGGVCVYRSVSATEVAFVANWCAVNVKVVIIFTGLHFHVF